MLYHLSLHSDLRELLDFQRALLGSVSWYLQRFKYEYHSSFGQGRKDVALEVQEPDVTIISPDRPDIVLEIPTSGNPKAPWFTLKEGSRYNLNFSIKVSNDIVCGLKYTNQVWKMGLKGTLSIRTLNLSILMLFNHFSRL
ncbi:hypothetical protein L1987_50921 [Smallanthus sonchifolius]|uniref:Uncharacterized protein n=1 Tax=Smallanthus sonchifolius TaxID=185202 RepID=A0ACB9EQ01_9ASTR|nr:hypothetical protein L1987_50921 [Smallanthus sonchifolius]